MSPEVVLRPTYFLDGELNQYTAATSEDFNVLHAYYNIDLVKSTASGTHLFQPCDVAICFKLMKQLIKSHKFRTDGQPTLQNFLFFNSLRCAAFNCTVSLLYFLEK